MASNKLFAMCDESLGMILDVLYDSSAMYPSWGMSFINSRFFVCGPLYRATSITHRFLSAFPAHVLPSLRELFPAAPPNDTLRPSV